MANPEDSQVDHVADIDYISFLAKPAGSEGLGELNVVLAGDETATSGLRKGTIMAKVTASGLYVPYLDSASDGSEVAVGILSQDVGLKDMYTVASDGVKTAKAFTVTLYTQGTVVEAELTGIDANGKTDLSGITFV